MKGDGYQNGGLIIVEKGGKLLYSYRQENPADHPHNDEILKVFLYYLLLSRLEIEEALQSKITG